MLVLTRRPQSGDASTITVGSDLEDRLLEVTVQSGKGGQVRLGIAAPRDLAVHRSEVHAEIAGELRTLQMVSSAFPGGE